MKTFRSFVSACAFLGAIAVTSVASATTFNFDFTGRNLSDRSSITYAMGDLSVTVTAGTFSAYSNPSNINFGTRRVDIDPNGLGADSWFDGDGVDGRFGNDVLVFTFNQEVTLNTISFTEVDRNDDFAFGTVAGRSFDRIVNFRDVRNPTDVSTFTSLSERTGVAFGIGAIQSNDNFRISGLSISTVPLPASGLLILAALGFGAGVARRKAAKAS